MWKFRLGLPLLLLFAAHGAAQAQATSPGGPDPMVCVYNTTLPTLVNGQTGYAQCDASGRIIISNPGSSQGSGTAADQTGSNASDAQATSTTNQHTLAFNYIYNGTTWDRARGVNGSASVTTTQTGYAAYGPDNVAAAPTKPPMYNGYADAGGLIRGVSPATQFPTQVYDQRGNATITATSTSGAGSFVDIPLNDAGTVGLNFSGLAASGATASYFITNVTGSTPTSTISSLNAATGQPSSTRTTDGDTRIAVGGHAVLRVQNTTAGTGTYTVTWNISNAVSIVDVRGPVTLVQGYQPLSSTNGLPTTDTNASQSFGSAGATTTKAQSVQGIPGGLAVPVSGTVAATQSGAPWATNQTQLAGTALGAPTTYGTAPTGVVPGTNAFVTNFPATQSVSGTTTANQGTPAAVANAWPTYIATAGAAVSSSNPFPAASFGQYNSTAPTLSSGGVAPLQLDTNGNLKTTIANTPSIYANGFRYTSPPTQPTNAPGLVAIDVNSQLMTSERGSADPVVGIVPNSGTGATCANGTTTTGCIAKNTAGNLYRAYATAPTAPSSQQYLACINATAVPAASAAIAPLDFAPFNLATTAGSTASINFGPGPPSGYTTGITCLITTSLTTYTAGTASLVNTGVR